MQGKWRWYLMAVGFVVVILGLVGAGFVFLEEEEGSLPFLLFSIALIVVLFGIIFLKKRYDDLKTGQPMVDERTQRVKEQAGYYSYLISLYLWLAIMFVNDTEANTLIGLGMVGMALIFFASWAILSGKERLDW